MDVWLDQRGEGYTNGDMFVYYQTSLSILEYQKRLETNEWGHFAATRSGDGN